VKPEAMAAPVCYLASDAAGDINGKRIVARYWDAQAPLADNLARAVSPAAWPDLAAGASPGAPTRGSAARS
jgi:hypothetical protein